MENDTLIGKLFFYSETGTEGGYWAFQDNNFISLTSPSYGIDENTKVWDIDDQNKFGKTLNAEVYLNNEWLPIPDPIWKDPDFEISSIYCGEIEGDLNADTRLTEKYNFKIKYSIQLLNETYGENNWKIDKKLPNVILKDGTQLIFEDTPTTEPERPYGIPLNGRTRVTVKWNNGKIEHNRESNTLLIEKWDYNGYTF